MQESNENPPYLISELKLKREDFIDTEYYNEANKYTDQYSFTLSWAPGFYSKHTCGFLAGGATFISDSGVPIFALKSSFKNKRKWFLYNISELLSHEFCHVARAPLDDQPYEEFFAYKLSQSKFRRYFGSFFHSPYDSIFLLLPLLLLLLVTSSNLLFNQSIPEIYFWILSSVFPGYLYIRNKYYISKFKKASKTLLKIIPESNIDSVLFRCNSTEIKEIASFHNNTEKKIKDLLQKYSAKDLRWKIITARFIKINNK